MLLLIQDVRSKLYGKYLLLIKNRINSNNYVLRDTYRCDHFQIDAEETGCSELHFTGHQLFGEHLKLVKEAETNNHKALIQ